MRGDGPDLVFLVGWRILRVRGHRHAILIKGQLRLHAVTAVVMVDILVGRAMKDSDVAGIGIKQAHLDQCGVCCIRCRHISVHPAWIIRPGERRACYRVVNDQIAVVTLTVRRGAGQ